MQCEAKDKIMRNTINTEKAEALNLFFTSVYQHCRAQGLGNKNPSRCKHRPYISEGIVGTRTITGAQPLQVNGHRCYPAECVKRAS